MNSGGWIKLYRSLRGHWLADDLESLGAWSLMLMSVCHAPSKVRIGNHIYELQPGESARSVETWARMFGWHRSKTRRFFTMLEADRMIERKATMKTTILKVCGWETYQQSRPDGDRMATTSRPDGDHFATTDKNNKNDKNEEEVPERARGALAAAADTPSGMIEELDGEDLFGGDPLAEAPAKTQTKNFNDLRISFPKIFYTRDDKEAWEKLFNLYEWEAMADMAETLSKENKKIFFSSANEWLSKNYVFDEED